MDTLTQLVDYYAGNSGYVWEQFLRHLLMSVYGVLFASIVSIPIGIYIARHYKMGSWVITVANIIQTIPALAMIAVLMVALGLGANTTVFVVFLYALLPILKNTYAGVRNVDQTLLESGRGMGMTKFQILRMVELPLSLSVIIAGVRTALVLAIGVTVIGAFIGAGGLGSIILRGMDATNGGGIILGGAIPAAVMAIIIDLLMGWLEKLLSPAKRTSPKKAEKQAA